MIRMSRQILVVCVVMISLVGCRHMPSGPQAPLIGVTSVYLEPDESWPARIIVPMTYVESVREAGGVPVVLPALESPEVIREYLRRLDGLVLVKPWRCWGGCLFRSRWSWACRWCILEHHMT